MAKGKSEKKNVYGILGWSFLTLSIIGITIGEGPSGLIAIISFILSVIAISKNNNVHISIKINLFISIFVSLYGIYAISTLF